MRKCFALLLALMLCIGLLTGCSANETTAQYTHHGLTITLPSEYLDLSEKPYAADYDFMYGLVPVIVSGLQEEKKLFLDNEMDLEGYGEFMMAANAIAGEWIRKDGVPTFTYEADGYVYTVTLWETEESFWLVQAYCPEKDYSAVSTQIWEILSSIKV